MVGVAVLRRGVKPTLLWYVWIHIVDGAWHKLEDIGKRLRIPNNAVVWAANFLNEEGLAELHQDGLIRLHDQSRRFEEAVKSLSQTG